MRALLLLLTACLALLFNECTSALSSDWLINVDECGVSKGCYRHPDKCRDDSDCVYFLTWQKVESNEIHFEYAAKFMAHPTGPWAGFGVADKSAMFGATVVDCIASGNGTVNIQMSYNSKKSHDNQPLNSTHLGLVQSSLQGAVIGSHIFCNFTRERIVTTPDPEGFKVKNLTMPYYVLFATGPTDGAGGKSIHDFIGKDDPFPSTIKIDFDKYSNFGDNLAKNAYIRTHATLVIVAWIVFASLGMFTSRYMKNQWKESGTCFGKPYWFQIHRYSMALVFVLTLVAVLVIFAYKKWTFIVPTADARSIHPTLGLTVCALLLANLLAGLLRPNIYSPYRTYFWVVHAVLGHTSHLLAAVTMFLGVMQYKAYMPEWTKWVVVGFAVWRALADLVMTFTRIRYAEQPANYVAMANNEIDEPATKVSAFRCAVMIVYLIGVVVLAATLIVAANVP